MRLCCSNVKEIVFSIDVDNAFVIKAKTTANAVNLNEKISVNAKRNRLLTIVVANACYIVFTTFVSKCFKALNQILYVCFHSALNFVVSELIVIPSLERT